MESQFATAFQLLGSTLTDAQDMWRPQPFTSNQLPWSRTHPHMEEALLGLSDARARELHDNPQARLHWFEQLEPDLCAALYRFDPRPTDIAVPLQSRSFDQASVPGRKWDQITAFAGALGRNQLPVVDWCAGKGHLSRVVQRSQQQPVHCLEWNAALVAEGELLAKKQHLDIRYYQHDVMQPLPAACAGSDRLHMGLHACGSLHHSLLQHVATESAAAVALSPCCYHKIAGELYQPLSKRAQQTRLILDRPSLHLAVQETATARNAERVLREQERLWRLAFDALQRDVRGLDEYLNVPSCRRQLLRQDFASFCRWAAGTRKLKLPAAIPYDHYLKLGLARQQKILRLELLRHLFGRPLELWLVLDCALHLEEHGYRVKISKFCEREVSPRNLLIQGYKT
jgi:hypothetical protein